MIEMPQFYPLIKRIILESVYLLLSCDDNQQMHTTVLTCFLTDQLKYNQRLLTAEFVNGYYII